MSTYDVENAKVVYNLYNYISRVPTSLALVAKCYKNNYAADERDNFTETQFGNFDNVSAVPHA